MIHLESDATGHWFICDMCGKTRTYDHLWQRDLYAGQHACIATATLIPNAR